MKAYIPLILLSSSLFLVACSGSGGGGASVSTGAGASRVATVSCADGALCPPAQVNAVNPNVN
jgi:hypothetical protein